MDNVRKNIIDIPPFLPGLVEGYEPLEDSMLRAQQSGSNIHFSLEAMKFQENDFSTWCFSVAKRYQGCFLCSKVLSATGEFFSSRENYQKQMVQIQSCLQRCEGKLQQLEEQVNMMINNSRSPQGAYAITLFRAGLFVDRQLR